MWKLENHTIDPVQTKKEIFFTSLGAALEFLLKLCDSNNSRVTMRVRFVSSQAGQHINCSPLCRSRGFSSIRMTINQGSVEKIHSVGCFHQDLWTPKDISFYKKNKR